MTDQIPTPTSTPPSSGDHDGAQLHTVELTVNGRTSTVQVPARRLLSDALRVDLGLTGTHVGCEHGVCGCCTVMIDGLATRSCLTLAVTADGRDIRTIEGLADDDGTLHPVQQAFRECHGLQCGFCTPGFLMTSVALLEHNPDPDDEQITEAIAGNLCRCTGYQNIKAAVRRAAELTGEGNQ
ncbi:MAG: (2Fe-2S)-binding protein [Actinomycetia bacterium]|nr:(2Fe-2S)-binding protein [Actinomycetes bacterium]